MPASWQVCTRLELIGRVVTSISNSLAKAVVATVSREPGVAPTGAPSRVHAAALGPMFRI